MLPWTNTICWSFNQYNNHAEVDIEDVVDCSYSVCLAARANGSVIAIFSNDATIKILVLGLSTP